VNVHGLRPGRATIDIDFGIAVGSWEQFAILKDRLIGTGDFADRRRVLQRSTPIGLPASPFRSISFRSAASPLRTEPSHGPPAGTSS
jgi:predicted nucleotidyltransferase